MLQWVIFAALMLQSECMPGPAGVSRNQFEPVPTNTYMAVRDSKHIAKAGITSAVFERVEPCPLLKRHDVGPVKGWQALDPAHSAVLHEFDPLDGALVVRIP